MKLHLYILLLCTAIIVAGIINYNVYACLPEEEDDNHSPSFTNVDVEIKYKGNGAD